LLALLAELGVSAVGGPTGLVSTSSLRPADSPRVAGEEPGHARALAQIDAAMPPILVHRATMRVVDGMHRLRAAELRGQDTIEVRFLDSSEELAFVIAVAENITHGLPLSLADREAAATRIVTFFPQWSDRTVATITALAPNTVGALRRRTAGPGGQPAARIGRDGRLRPVDGARGRQLAAAMIAERPAASLREIAAAAGVSPSTAKDVRDRIRRGEDAVPADRRAARSPIDDTVNRLARTRPSRRTGALAGREPRRDPVSVLRILKRDPALRFTESGRELLRWLDARVVDLRGWERYIDTVPAHCAYLISELAVGCADQWLALAAQLQERVRATESA
jgi:hypothetical protein